MSFLSNLLFSLILTTVLSFSAPILLLAIILITFSVVSYLPGCYEIAHTALERIWGFLIVFGDGYALEGIFTIAFTFAIVGGLFDLFNFYRYQTLKGH